MTFSMIHKVPKIVTDMHSVTKKLKNKSDFSKNFVNFKIMEFCENQIFTLLLVGATVLRVHQYNVPHFLATLMD